MHWPGMVRTGRRAMRTMRRATKDSDAPRKRADVRSSRRGITRAISCAWKGEGGGGEVRVG